MCGICGIYYFDRTRPVDSEKLKRMMAALFHRGPDESGVFIKNNIGLGTQRLSIIDIKNGQQPMMNETGSIRVAYNGEIYNYQELKRALYKKGHIFKSNCDTEVILHAYEEYGEDCFNYFNGMFAAAIWNCESEKLILGRDHAGIKPLFYKELNKDGLIFSSEIRSLLEGTENSREICYEALNYYLTFGNSPGPLTLLQDIKSLEPGHILICQKGVVVKKKYFEWKFNNDFESLENKNENEIADALYIKLKKAVHSQLMSEVPLGIFLSGGVDSSAIVALARETTNQPLKTFSIGFKEKTYDETRYAKIISERFGTHHEEFYVGSISPNLIEHIVQKIGEPISDFAFPVNYILAKETKKHVTVALSGEGADELFGGYEPHLASKIATFYDFMPSFLRSSINSIFNYLPPTEKRKGLINLGKAFLEGASQPKFYGHLRWMTFFSKKEKDKLFSFDVQNNVDNPDTLNYLLSSFNELKFKNRLEKELYINFNTCLPNQILAKLDRTSMAHSLETRVPFLDKDVVAFVQSIPSHLKLKGFHTKYILKKSMKGLLPPIILNRQKQGFVMPVKIWLKSHWLDWMRDILSEEILKKQGIFNPIYINNLIKEHLEGRHNHSQKLWNLIIFQSWYRTIFLKT